MKYGRSEKVWFGHIYWETLKRHIDALVFLGLVWSHLLGILLRNFEMSHQCTAGLPWFGLLVLVVGPGPGVLPHVSVLYVEPSVLENVLDF